MELDLFCLELQNYFGLKDKGPLRILNFIFGPFFYGLQAIIMDHFSINLIKFPFLLICFSSMVLTKAN